MEYLIERTSRDLVNVSEQSSEDRNGYVKKTYRLQKEEVDLLADLLLKLLRCDPAEREGWPKVLMHKWFGKRFRCMAFSISSLHRSRDWPERKSGAGGSDRPPA